MLKIGVIGSKGKMGQRICALVEKAADLQLSARIDREHTLAQLEQKNLPHVLIDFSTIEATLKHAPDAALRGIPLVIGTTGLNETQLAVLKKAAESTAIVFAPNMSVGVNVLFTLLATAAKSLGTEFRVSMEETHHVHKKDAPSGTAKKAREVILHNSSWQEKDVPITAHREGEVIGDHHITFSSPLETLTLSHHAVSRDLFASGALTAARWVVSQKPGLYSMQDVLSL